MQREPEFIGFGLTPSGYTWRGVGLLAFVYFGAMVFAAIISPPIYWGFQAMGEGAEEGFFAWLASRPYEDVFDRCRWVPVVIGLPWLLKRCGLLSWKALGIHFDQHGRRFLFNYLRLGQAVLLVAVALQVIFTVVEPDGMARDGRWLEALFTALAGGLVLGFLEEIVFRGLIFRIFYTAMKPLAALIVMCFFFAYTHFKMPDAVWNATDGVVHWHSGFYVALWTALGITQDFEALRFITLVVLGFWLGLLALRTKSLMPCIGLHAGLVFIMLSYHRLARPIDDGFPRLLFGGESMTDGIVPLLIITVLALREYRRYVR